MSDSGSPLWRVMGQLEDTPRKSGTGYVARCPAHEDRHASLAIGLGLNGRVLLDCHAGCPTEKVVAALGLSMSDLFEKSAAGNPVRRFRLLDKAGHTVATHVREDRPDSKEMWWESGGRKGLNGTALDSLPLYRLPDLLAAEPGTPIILTEGEKAADALVELGLLALGTVTGAGSAPGPSVLEPLQGHEVWLWPDNDDAGRQHMAKIALHLKPEPRWVTWANAPPKGDAADYVAQGGTAEGVRLLVQVKDQPTHDVYIGDMAALQRKVLPEPRWAVPGIFPEGVVLLVGKSKLGKSWFALDVANAVSSGAKAWGEIQVEQGEVLYLALEDSERRLSDRMSEIYGQRAWPGTFLYAVKFPRADEGGLELTLEWLNNHPRARLVIIDVLGKFRPREANNRRLYDMDYEAVAPIAELARQRGVCVLILHHANKLKPDDPIDSVSGTTGLAGAADAICIFRRERGKVDASLLITGRDVEEQELAFKFVLSEHRGHAWELIGDAASLRLSRERQEIIDVVTSQQGVTPVEIAAGVGRSTANVRHLLFKMVRGGQIRVIENRYFLPFSTTPGNRGNGVTLEIKNSHFSVTPGVTPTPGGVTLQAITPVTPITPVTSITTVTSPENSKNKGVTAKENCAVCGRSYVEHSAEERTSGCKQRLPYKEDT